MGYHDDEWGRPVVDDDRLFERLCLEGFQSGLSWLTILRKREGFRAAFADFRIDRVAAFDGRDVERLLGDERIVRNRRKIEATIENARRRFDEIASELAATPDGGSITVGFAELSPGDSPTDLINRADTDLLAARHPRRSWTVAAPALDGARPQ